MIHTYTFSKGDDDNTKVNVDIGDINPADYDVKGLLLEIHSLKNKISKMEEQEKIDNMYIEDCSVEIDRLNSILNDKDGQITMWMSKYENAIDDYKKAQHERDLLKEIISEKSDVRKFTVRQTAIIAYALCKRSGFVPKNKKNISPIFQDLTGRSANTLASNLCSTYSDDEIEEIAVVVEKNMPEFATYLREKNFFHPEIKK